MASKKAPLSIKRIKDNSRIKEIGSMYRRVGGSDWRINISLDPGQHKKNFAISQLTVLARRRVLNATEHFKPAEYPATVHVDDATMWSHRRIRECPIKNLCELQSEHANRSSQLSSRRRSWCSAPRKLHDD